MTCPLQIAGKYYDVNNPVEPGGDWPDVASMSTPRAFHQLLPAPNGFVAVGGRVNDTYDTDTSEFLDPVANSWTSYPWTLITPRSKFCAVLYNEIYFVVGGEE